MRMNLCRIVLLSITIGATTEPSLGVVSLVLCVIVLDEEW